MGKRLREAQHIIILAWFTPILVFNEEFRILGSIRKMQEKKKAGHKS